MICIIVYKYTFVNSFLNIFTNLFILSLFYMFTVPSLCIITNIFTLTKGEPPVSGRHARVRILFYALFMHNILLIMNWINFFLLSKSFPYYHNNVIFAIVYANFSHGYFIFHCALNSSIRSNIKIESLCIISGHSVIPDSIARKQLRNSYSYPVI